VKNSSEKMKMKIYNFFIISFHGPKRYANPYQTHVSICLHWKIAIFRNFQNIAKLLSKIDSETSGSTGLYYIGVYTKAKRVFRKYGISHLCAFLIFLKTVLFWVDFPPFCHILGTKISSISRKLAAIRWNVWRLVIF